MQHRVFPKSAGVLLAIATVIVATVLCTRDADAAVDRIRVLVWDEQQPRPHPLHAANIRGS